MFVFLLSPILGFSQINVNEDSVNYYFTQIINEYRGERLKLETDTTLKPFSDYWAQYLYYIKRTKDSSEFYSDYYHHGIGDNQFKNRKRRYSNLINSENAIEPWDVKWTPVFLGDKSTGSINKDVARYIFHLWKNSPSHNEVMLLEETKYFYLSTYIVNGKITVSYVGSVDIY